MQIYILEPWNLIVQGWKLSANQKRTKNAVFEAIPNREPVSSNIMSVSIAVETEMRRLWRPGSRAVGNWRGQGAGNPRLSRCGKLTFGGVPSSHPFRTQHNTGTQHRHGRVSRQHGPNLLFCEGLVRSEWKDTKGSPRIRFKYWTYASNFASTWGHLVGAFLLYLRGLQLSQRIKNKSTKK